MKAWEKCKYIVKIAIRLLFRNRTVHLSVLLSFSLGIILPIFVLGIGSSLTRSITSKVPIGVERCGFFSTKSRCIGINQKAGDFSEIELMIELEANSPEAYVNSGSFYVLGDVSGVGKGTDKLTDLYLGSGRFFNESELENGENVCVVGSQIYSKLDSPKSVYFWGEQFTVVGVSLNGGNDEEIYIPINTAVHFHEINEFVYIFRMQSGLEFSKKGQETGEKIVNELGLSGTAIEAMQSIMNPQDLANLRNAELALGGIALIVLVYSIANITSVLINKYEHERDDNLIRISLGASQPILFLTFFAQLSLLTICAVAFDLFLVYALKSQVESVLPFSFQIDSPVVMKAFGIAIVCAAMLSLILLLKIRIKTK